MDRISKDFIKSFQKVGFKIEIKTSFKTVNYLDLTLDFTNHTYQPYKKLNDFLLYVSISSNHPPQVIKHLLISINKRLNKKSSSEEILNESKSEYETALKNCGYHNTELKFDKKEQNTPQQKQSRSIIWFNPRFSRNVTTNVAKTFLNLLDKYLPKSNKLHTVFNRNIIKVSYCCTEKLFCIIRSHNNNMINGK